MFISRRDFVKQCLLYGGYACISPEPLLDAEVKKTAFIPGYKKLLQQGVLLKRVKELYAVYENCALCPRECGVNRLKGEKGICRSTAEVKVASAYPHQGEERALVGKTGSGTIFFSNCNLRCVFCINYPINHHGQGRLISESTLAGLMLSLQKKGCKNINLVTPSHYVPCIVKAVYLAAKSGLSIPLVYNTSSYDGKNTLRLLRGIVDIYLPDLKYMKGEHSGKYSFNAYDYPQLATANIKEMFAQVGNLTVDSSGNALKGLILRHLVMPNNVSDTDLVVKWIARNLGKASYVNLRGQYRPMYKAFDYPKINRRLTRDEFKQAVHWAGEAGLTNLDKRSLAYS